MEIKSGLTKEKTEEGEEKDPLDDSMRISTITALARAIHEQSLAHRRFRQNNNGESGPVYSKRDLYERGHVAVCSHRQATCITVFVFSSIFLSSLVIAFARPWNECAPPDIVEGPADVPGAAVETVLVASSGEVFPWDEVRLPIFIRPVEYDLELTPNLTTLAVSGIVKMVFKVTEETDFIVFHMSGMNITSKTINEKLKIQRLLELPAREQVYLQTDRPMRPGTQFSVRLRFEYQLSHSLEGFYLSTYTDQAGKERRLATTHFEPTYARRAFPCFDEPQLKAEFIVTIVHHEDHKVFFNMPLREQSVAKGHMNTLRDEFNTTKKMSTYLLAFVICDFSVETKRTPTNNINVSVIAAPDKIDQTEFALKAAVELTDYYEEYFGINYPLPKQDLIAIPDFGAGAMENWGLITYRETSLLFSRDKSSSKSQQWVAIVVAHELAHQWFGNLVTMRWWNDLWLNEGFASWMEYKGVEHLQPDWRMMEQFWAAKLLPALHLDSLASSHPISVPVKDPKEIEAIFDTISYKKGSSIIHMLESFLGEAELRAGLKQYLSQHRYDTAVTRDLWAALTKASTKGLDVAAMMDTWTLQMGYPLVTFSRTAVAGQWSVTQERFLTSGQLEGVDPALPPARYNYTWTVPLTLQTDAGTELQLVLTHANTSATHIQLPEDTKWFKANLGGRGYYRVQYPEAEWRALTAQLAADHTQLGAVDRAQLIDDAFSLLRAGQLPPAVPLELVAGYLARERSLVAWEVALAQLSSLAQLFRESEARENLNKLILQLLEPVCAELGWEDAGSHVDRMLREHVLRAAVEAEHADATARAKQMFAKLRSGEEGVAANLRALVYSVGVRTGTEADWEWSYAQYRSTNIPSDRALLIRAMGESTNIFTLQKYLTMSLNSSQVRGQDVHSVLAAVASNPSGSLLAWRHLQRHWAAIWTTFHSGSFTMGAIIKSVVSHFSTQFDYDQVKQFFDGKDVGAGELALKQSMEQIQINIEFRRKYEPEISEWLKQKMAKN